MKNIRAYMFEASGQYASYASRGRKGSRQNYDDLKRELSKSYGRYSLVKSWNDYKYYKGHIFSYC